MNKFLIKLFQNSTRRRGKPNTKTKNAKKRAKAKAKKFQMKLDLEQDLLNAEIQRRQAIDRERQDRKRQFQMQLNGTFGSAVIHHRFGVLSKN